MAVLDGLAAELAEAEAAQQEALPTQEEVAIARRSAHP